MTTKKRISKTESIKQILQLLREGYATEEILEEISSNWVLPETTFYNHFKEAKKTYNNELHSPAVSSRSNPRSTTCPEQVPTRTSKSDCGRRYSRTQPDTSRRSYRARENQPSPSWRYRSPSQCPDVVFEIHCSHSFLSILVEPISSPNLRSPPAHSSGGFPCSAIRAVLR